MFGIKLFLLLGLVGCVTASTVHCKTGENCYLPCQVNASQLTDATVEWANATGATIFSYRNTSGSDPTNQLNNSRASVASPDGWRNGNITIILTGVTQSDTGNYNCSVNSTVVTTIELTVADPDRDAEAWLVAQFYIIWLIGCFLFLLCLVAACRLLLGEMRRGGPPPEDARGLHPWSDPWHEGPDGYVRLPSFFP